MNRNEGRAIVFGGAGGTSGVGADGVSGVGAGGIDSGDVTIIPRPVPAWKPKNNDPVLFRDERDGLAKAAFYFNELLYVGSIVLPAAFCAMVPFDASKLNKPWSEI